MRLGKLTLFSCAAVLTLPMLGAGQQPSSATPTIKVYSRETIVDVLVTDDKGQPVGVAEDFITGWLAPAEKQKGRWMGRPVGIVFGGDGSMYLSDDSAGVIYRVTWNK